MPRSIKNNELHSVAAVSPPFMRSRGFCEKVGLLTRSRTRSEMDNDGTDAVTTEN